MRLTTIYQPVAGALLTSGFLRSNFAWLLLIITVPGISRGETIRFATGQGTAAPISAFYVDPFIDNYRFSGTVQGRSFEDATLDSTAQTILYNKMTLWTDAPNVRSATYDEVIPGTFQTVQTHATISVDPVSTSVMNVGPLTLHQSISEFDIQPNLDGSHGGFATIPLTGTYSITRESQTVSGQFAVSLPIYRAGAFPEEYLYVDNYPNSIDLKGVGFLESLVQWIDWPSGQNNPNRRTIFSGMLDGFPAVLELQDIYFNRNGRITLSAIPEPTTLVMLFIGSPVVTVSRRFRYQ